MTIFNEPQPHRSIVPFMLREFLTDLLRDVDESTWQHLSAEERAALTERAVSEVRQVLPRIREKIGKRFLPTPPQGVRLADLELEVRTFNCLEKLGVDEDTQLIGCLTINDLLATRNFGVKSLVDLLTSLEFIESRSPIVKQHEREELPSFQIRETLNLEDIKVIRECYEQKSYIPTEVRRRNLPKLPDNLRLDRLDLRNRTYNCLEKARFIDRPQELSGQTVDSLLALPNFGRNSLIDLLIVLEPFLYLTEEDHRRMDEAAEELAVEAKLLVSMTSAELIPNDDPRLGRLLRAISPDAKNALEAAEQLLSGTHASIDPATVTHNIRQLREQVEALSQIKLEDELMSLIVGVRSQRNAEIFARRLGLDGGNGVTLQELGDEYGMTRERIRQIYDGIERHLRGRRPFAPMLDSALELVVKNLPGSASEIEMKLQTEGIAKKPFRIEGLQNAAKLLGRGVPYSLADMGKQRAVLVAGTEYSANKILQVARRAIEHWGTATIEDVTIKAAEKSAFPADLVLRVITSQEDFRWLDEQGGWFWLRSVPRNRLRTQIKKILSVTDRIDVGELRAGVGRSRRMEGFAPPRRVLLELCHQLSWCLVEGHSISAHSELDWRETLSESEQIMAAILKSHGPAMPRERFEEECLARGMTRTTFYAYLNYSPVITRHARSVYGLRGVHVPPGLVESLKPKILRGRVLKDCGWTLEGKLWVGYQLSESTIAGGVCSIPFALARFIKGEFSLNSADGSSIGNLATNNTSAWGLKPLFRRKGGEAGDYLVLLFDLAAQTAVAYLGDESILEDFQSVSRASRDEETEQVEYMRSEPQT